MMHHCCSSQGNMVGPCSCGLYHCQNNSYSMLYSYQNSYYDEQQQDMYSPYASSSVDCTLSLGTPSTRLSEDDERKAARPEQRRNGVSSLCWDFLQNKHASSQQSHRNSRGNGSSSSSSSNNGNDTLLARRCANCDTTSTPLWRNGPRGPKSLCNACGIRFKKEERRASAANANMNNTGASMGAMEQHHMMNNSWYHHSQTQKMPYFSPAIGNELRFIEDDNGNSDAGYPYLSWRLNVADRPTSLVHDFTR